MEAIQLVQKMCGDGIKARFSVLETLEESEAFAKSRGIAKVIKVG